MNADGTSDRNLINLDCSNGASQDFSGAMLQAPDSTYTGIFKYSGQQKGPLTVTAGEVRGGSETCVDVNNLSTGLDITAKIWDATPCKYAFSVKGGSGATIHGIVRGRSKECEAFAGNWSDQSHLPSVMNLDLRPEDGKTPIRVRYFDDTVTYTPGSGPYIVIFPWAWLPFRGLIRRTFAELRRHPFTAKLFGLA